MNASVQHLPDIEIPVIEITEGWSADSCRTHKDCNDAFAYLMAAVASIELQIDVEMTKPKESQDRLWVARANCALKYKKAALQIVNQRRSEINARENRAFQERRDANLLKYIKSIVPNETFLAWVRASGVNEEEMPR